MQRRRGVNERGRRLCLFSTAQSTCGRVCCGLVAVCERELRDEEGEVEV